MDIQLEPAMVADFVAAGRPKASSLSWQERREGYLASAILGGEQEEVGAVEEWQNGHYSVRLYRPVPTSSASRPALSGLPLTHIVTAEYDPLRDEGETLYRKLLQAGVTATCQRQLGVIHGFFQLAGLSQAARQTIELIAMLIRLL